MACPSAWKCLYTDEFGQPGRRPSNTHPMSSLYGEGRDVENSPRIVCKSKHEGPTTANVAPSSSYRWEGILLLAKPSSGEYKKLLEDVSGGNMSNNNRHFPVYVCDNYLTTEGIGQDLRSCL